MSSVGAFVSPQRCPKNIIFFWMDVATNFCTTTRAKVNLLLVCRIHYARLCDEFFQWGFWGLLFGHSMYRHSKRLLFTNLVHQLSATRLKTSSFITNILRKSLFTELTEDVYASFFIVTYSFFAVINIKRTFRIVIMTIFSHIRILRVQNPFWNK